ncbi:hypothetical protein FRB90_009067, partial [Tulasnella sp. 427]
MLTTSQNHFKDIVQELEYSLNIPTILMPIYLLIWWLRTLVFLFLHASLLWIRFTWKALSLPFVITVRVQSYAVFRTLEACSNALTW